MNTINIFNTFQQVISFLSPILELLAAFGIAGIIYKAFKYRIKVPIAKLAYKVFTDRKPCIKAIDTALQSGTKVINVYGRRGVGKSAFLAFVANYINNNLGKENSLYGKEIKKMNPKLRWRRTAIYLEISAYQDAQKILSEFSNKITGKESDNIREIANKLKRRFFLSKQIIIIFDNLNNPALETAVEDVIRLLWEQSEKFVFIIGSIDNLSLLELKNTEIKSISMPVFSETDINEYINNNCKKSQKISAAKIAQILDISEGLPVFVSFLLAAESDDNTAPVNNKSLHDYINKILDTLPDETLEIARYISLLSITTVEVDYYDLVKLGIQNLKKHIYVLENSSVLYFDDAKHVIKMHELFRDYINTDYMSDLQCKLNNILQNTNVKTQFHKKIYYLMLSEHISDTQNRLMQKIVADAVNEENYTFLIYLGEHLKRFSELQYNTSYGMEINTFKVIIWGYIEGLLGIGNYLAAKDVINICKIAIRNPQSEIDFRLGLTVANLHHLQNEYDVAISSYQCLLVYAVNSFSIYRAYCYYGIAHSYRHQSLYFDLAIDNYRKAIHYAKKSKNNELTIRCKHELMTVYVFLDKPSIAGTFIKDMENFINTLPKDSEKLAIISYYKSKARFLRFYMPSSDKQQYDLLINIRKDYERIKKRLQYNSYFELGEYHRIRKEYKEAYEQYNIAYKFSCKNQDVNLESMCFYGILLLELESNQFVIHNSYNDQKHSLLHMIEKCCEKDLHYNIFIGQIIYYYITGSDFDPRILKEMSRVGYSRECEIATGVRSINDLYLILT